MFGRKRRILELEIERDILRAALVAEKHKNHKLMFDMVNRPRSQPRSSQFTKEEIERLIRLCHPDKHGGNKAATEMTQKLLRLRG